MNLKLLWHKFIVKVRNKIGLTLYLKSGRVESLSIENSGNHLEEKWAFKSTGCVVEKKTEPEQDGLVDLSIIVPLYNSEKFIDECVNGLLQQKTKYKYEIILVNDGSSDNTYIIAEQYRIKHSDRIILLNQENKGISAARNAGIEMARGRYIAFADHDDSLDPTFVEKMMEAAYREDADIVKSAFADIRNGRVQKPQEQDDVIIHGPMKEKLFRYKSYIFPGVYKGEVFEQIRFPEGFWYEDMIVRMLLYRQAKVFVHISDVLYYKKFHEQNASFVVWNITNYKCLEHLYMVINMLEENKKMGLPEDVWFYQSIMRELSFILSLRVRKLDEDTRKTVFLRACEIVTALYKAEYETYIMESNKIWQRVFFQKEYKLWLLLSGHYYL